MKVEIGGFAGDWLMGYFDSGAELDLVEFFENEWKVAKELKPSDVSFFAWGKICGYLRLNNVPWVFAAKSVLCEFKKSCE